MGWNELVLIPQIDAIFRKQKKKYRVQWVSSTYPQIRIQYEDSIPLSSAQEIITLFPESVYVELIPHVTFAKEQVESPIEFRK